MKHKILFVCHGNICRSPAAEFICKKYLKEIGRDSEFSVSSYAVSLEEIGNDIYPPMKRELTSKGIPFDIHYATRITQRDYDEADYVGTIVSIGSDATQEIAPKSDFSDSVRMPFGEYEYTVPAEYDKILRRQYGDYLQLPPEADRQIPTIGAYWI